MIHVVDSNRPQNLESLFSEQPEAQRIVVWDDGNVDSLRKQREAYEILSVCVVLFMSCHVSYISFTQAGAA